jgi:hypothetical protein
MKLAIMQSSIFHYQSYFQLIRAVDAFVVYEVANRLIQPKLDSCKKGGACLPLLQ